MNTDESSLGKFSRKNFEDIVLPFIKSGPETIFPPRFGMDFSAIRMENGKIMVTSSDPLAISPEIGWNRSGRLAFQVVAADVAASGISPRYISVNWNLPPEITDGQFEKVWSDFVLEAEDCGVEIIGGHTARYEGCQFPMVGAATVLGVGSENDLLTKKVSEGDVLFLLNYPGLEAASILALYYPQLLDNRLEKLQIEDLIRKFDRTNVVNDLQKISSYPGVALAHDLAEGGLIGGLGEMVNTMDAGVKIEKENINVPKNVEMICSEFDLDPLKITSVGAAVLVIKKSRLEEFQNSLENKINLTAIGRIEGKHVTVKDGEETYQEKDSVRDLFWDKLSKLKKS